MQRRADPADPTGKKKVKIPEKEIHDRVMEMLEIISLKGFENRKPDALSGGQQQRVAIARALVNQPKVLLLDEPLGALDLKLRKDMQIELKRIQQQVGITFIYVTHDQEEALTMSDTVVVMDKGLSLIHISFSSSRHLMWADSLSAAFTNSSTSGSVGVRASAKSGCSSGDVYKRQAQGRLRRRSCPQLYAGGGADPGGLP